MIPQGLRFAVDLPDGPSRGYVSEIFGAHFQLPDLGPIGNNKLFCHTENPYLPKLCVCVQVPMAWLRRGISFPRQHGLSRSTTLDTQ